MKHYLDVNVYDQAVERIRLIFDRFDMIVVSYSGGKDSSVLLELARREARRREKKIYALYIDPEVQYAETIRQIENALIGDPLVETIWICVPLLWRNAVSVFQPHWRTWDPKEREHWARPLPNYPCVISNPAQLPFWDENFGMEEIVEEFPKWFCPSGQSYASLVGIRADESFHRYTAIKGKRKKNRWHCDGRKIIWSTLPNEKTPHIVNLYPLYDWGVEDVWKFIGDTGLRYNGMYDRMYLAGVPIHDQRICQPYGDEQRRGLDQWAKMEPETWAAALERVAGVNYGARYSGGKMLGYQRGLDLPECHTWKSYTFFLLSTMPDVVRERYLGNFAIAIEWYMKEVYYKNIAEIPDDDTPIPNPSGFNIPSWRKMCLSILKNDFWGLTLDIGVTKFLQRDIYDAVAQNGKVVVRTSVQPFYHFMRQQYENYLSGGVEQVALDFTHPSVDPLAVIKEKWKDL